jgi:LAO/AO transport system kinase
VGVGQSEIEIASAADVTVVVLVPESGDEVQTMKAGIMEIGDIFVVNKSDRPGADAFVKNLNLQLSPSLNHKRENITVVKTIATRNEGTEDLKTSIFRKLNEKTQADNINHLAEKAYSLISKKRMKDVDMKKLGKEISADQNFNLYRFIKNYN